MAQDSGALRVVDDERPINLKVKPILAADEGSLDAIIEISELSIELLDAEEQKDPRRLVPALKRARELIRGRCSALDGYDLDTEIKRLSIVQFQQVLSSIMENDAVPPANGSRSKPGGRARAGHRRG